MSTDIGVGAPAEEVMQVTVAAPLPRAVVRNTTEVQRYLGRNYAAHTIEGALFTGALTFVNANTLLPAIVHMLHGPSWLVSLMPVMMLVGYLVPPIFTAYWIDRLHQYMPLLLTTGIAQRLPYLVAAWALLTGADDNPTLALAVVALAPFVSGVAGGISVTAWQQLVANTLPDNRRSSMFAIRFAGSSLIGIIAGYVAKEVLQAYPGTYGYGILHLCTFALLMGSYFTFATIREPRVTPPRATGKTGLWASLLAMPGLIRNDRRLAIFLLSRFFRNGIFILTPFLAIHCQQLLGRPESYIGQLLIVQMIGAILGNLACGLLGDRLGGKIVTLVGLIVCAILSAWAGFATSNWEFQIIFFLFGIGFFASEIGAQTLSLEVCPAENRSSHLALTQLVNLPGMLLASWASVWLWAPHQSFAGTAIVSAIVLTLGVVVTLPIKEPRQEASANSHA